MDRIDDGLEIKAGAGNDIAALFAEFSTAFEEFKRTNDQRLGEIEKRGTADGLLEGKLERLNAVLDGHKAAMDRAKAERARPAIEGKGQVENGEYKEAFSAYVKRGEEKALSIGVPADGGYVVPAEVETEITRLMTHISPHPRHCRCAAGVGRGL
jgi:HK97 family phage major capsid protein